MITAARSGGSTALGALGYIQALFELLDLGRDSCLGGHVAHLFLRGPDGEDDRGKAQGADDQADGVEREGKPLELGQGFSCRVAPGASR
jgi:hypothetical protein